MLNFGGVNVIYLYIYIYIFIIAFELMVFAL